MAMQGRDHIERVLLPGAGQGISARTLYDAREISEYWINEFLHSDFRTTGRTEPSHYDRERIAGSGATGWAGLFRKMC
jgi:hypothetical protein